MTRQTHDVTTRSSVNDELQIPEPRYEIFRNSLKYQGSVLWNNLPSRLRQATDIGTFKRLYKAIYF